MDKVHYVVATDRARNRWMIDYLKKHRGCLAEFTLIEYAEDLDPQKLDALAPRYIFFPHWSTRIPSVVYENHECVVFHMTDLPYGRGGTPLQNLILRGHTETKISALRCARELDAGPVYLKRCLSLDGNAEEILQRAGGAIMEMIEWIIDHEPEPQEQQGEPTVFCRRTPEQSNLSAAGSLDECFDYIRMLDADGYPHAFIETDGLRLEFRDAEHHGDRLSARVDIRVKGRQD